MCFPSDNLNTSENLLSWVIYDCQANAIHALKITNYGTFSIEAAYCPRTIMIDFNCWTLLHRQNYFDRTKIVNNWISWIQKIIKSIQAAIPLYLQLYTRRDASSFRRDSLAVRHCLSVSSFLVRHLNQVCIMLVIWNLFITRSKKEDMRAL